MLMPTVTLEVHFHSPTVKRTWDEPECLKELSHVVDIVDGKIDELNKTGEDEQKFKNICKEFSTWENDTKKKYDHCFRETFLELYRITQDKVKIALEKCATSNKAREILAPDHKEATDLKTKEESQEQNSDCNKEPDSQAKKCPTLLEHKKQSHQKGDLVLQEEGDQKTRSVQLQQTKEDIPPAIPPNEMSSINIKETMETLPANRSSSLDTQITEMGDGIAVLTMDGSEVAGRSDRSSGSSQERSKDNPGLKSIHSTGNFINTNTEPIYASLPSTDTSSNLFDRNKEERHLSFSGSDELTIRLLSKAEPSFDATSPRTGHSKPIENLEADGHVYSPAKVSYTARQQSNVQGSPDVLDAHPSPEKHVGSEDNHRNSLSSQSNQFKASELPIQKSVSRAMHVNKNDKLYNATLI
ncbi:PIR Superfamily Protein [Plasmodium ovale wallikeri]|uniref:PIR Superfamily Protein n=1 Tax=Plasmodium ovale wallikeri TaxID=864142 RepID=A0A1A8YLN4_PLAOA|nr:PIR Superfamily Protein [Plasmodium ovale wallikeri]